MSKVLSISTGMCLTVTVSEFFFSMRIQNQETHFFVSLAALRSGVQETTNFANASQEQNRKE